jgi:RimJ/RimL family protein N-acetyltransferase
MITLTCFCEDDIPILFEIQSDKKLAKLRQAHGTPATLSDVKTWLDEKNKQQSNEDFILAIRENNNHSIVGYITLKRESDDSAIARLGIMIGKLNGQGIGTQSLLRIESLVIESNWYQYLRVFVLKENSIAMRFFLKNNFVQIFSSDDTLVLQKELKAG